MSNRRADPERWRDGDTDAHAIEERAALLADAAAPVQPLSAPALTRIRGQVVARRTRRGALGGGFPWQLRMALALALLAAGGASAAGARLLWRRYVSPVRTEAPPSLPHAAPVTTRHSVARVAVQAQPDVAPPVLEPAPFPVPPSPTEADLPAPSHAHLAALPTVTSHPRTGVEPAPPPAQSAAPGAPPSKASEAALLAQALVDLRQRNDPRAALATLDRYAREFPHGVLEAEALRTRVEAVVQRGDLKAALALLDGQAAAASGEELLLTRAELRAAAGRFREALADFTQVLDGEDGSSISGTDERALYGRAVCLGRLGESERARADLILYQKWFPRGRFTVEVDRLLAGPPSAR